MSDLNICTKCNGGGLEYRIITHPLMNVHGWLWAGGDKYVRACKKCCGTGYVPRLDRSVPSVPQGVKL